MVEQVNMRIIELSSIQAIMLSIVIWGLLQTLAAFICLKIPDRFFDPERFFFRSHGWEDDGRVYNRVLKVHVWKQWLPDGGAVLKNGYRKKKLDNLSPVSLRRFQIESCRGELSHWLAIMPFWVFGLFAPPEVIGIMLVYALVINGPCIIAQRYNRPRVHRILEKMMRAELVAGKMAPEPTVTEENQQSLRRPDSHSRRLP